MICPDCGEELDDFAPCGCQFAKGPPSKAKSGAPAIHRLSMRELVARKLERERRGREG
jgi:hypothetical protein